MLNPYERRGIMRNGMVRGQGQQSGDSIYLDRSQTNPDDEIRDFSYGIEQRQRQRDYTPGEYLGDVQGRPLPAAVPNYMRALMQRDAQGPATGMHRMPDGSMMPDSAMPQRGMRGGDQGPMVSTQLQQYRDNRLSQESLTPDLISRIYADRLGRTPGEEEVAQHMTSPTGTRGFIDVVNNSDEYRNRLAQQALDQPPVGGGYGRGYGRDTIPGRDPASLEQVSAGMPDYSMLERGAGWRTGEVMNGWDAQKWGNQKSVKYFAGEILSRYPPTPEGLRQAVQDPDFRRVFPQARLIEDNTGDKIDFGGVLSDFDHGVPVNVVDVGKAFSAGGGEGWTWLDHDAIAREGGMGAPVTGYGGGTASTSESNILRALTGGVDEGNINTDELLRRLLAELGPIQQLF